MNHQIWTKADEYVERHVLAHDPDLSAVLTASDAGGLPPIQVSPTQGKLLYLLAKTAGAKRILEIGTLGGYSTIWMARALPESGRLITIEMLPKHAEVARKNLIAARVSDLVTIELGVAVKSLHKLAQRGEEPFDLVFIDADKENIPFYFEWSLDHSHPGTLIVVDNMIREGSVLDPDTTDPDARGVRRLNELIAVNKRVSATTIQTVGRKGYDGFMLARVME